MGLSDSTHPLSRPHYQLGCEGISQQLGGGRRGRFFIPGYFKEDSSHRESNSIQSTQMGDI